MSETNNPQNNIQSFPFHNHIPLVFHQTISKLFFLLGINGKEYVDDFIVSYIKHAKSKTHKNSDVYAVTGFGRRIVEKNLYRMKQQHSPYQNMHLCIVNELEKQSRKNTLALIPIRSISKVDKYKRDLGIKNTMTFMDIFNIHQNPSTNITPKSMLRQLIRVGILVKHDKHCVMFQSRLLGKGLRTSEDVIRNLDLPPKLIPDFG